MSKLKQWFTKKCWGFHKWQYETSVGEGIVGSMLICKKCGKVELIGYGMF